jgi:hypothetical protein
MEIKPFDNCPALDGYHCQTNSLAKIYHYYNCPVSEDMLLGLGAGMGFMYWHQKGVPPFIGGRANVKNFFHDLGTRTSTQLDMKSTSSEKKAESVLLDTLKEKKPVMVFGDMGFLPWFDLPEEYHFGGHTFVVCGYDGKDMVLASDIDQKASGLKKGFYYPISIEQLRKARSSKFKPFPPKNSYLECNFNDFQYPTGEDLYTAIRQTVDMMLNPPISNFGIKGIRRTSQELMKWPNVFSDKELRMNLFTLYIFIEIGGTGGGCFRYMYSRFLKEAADITSNTRLNQAASKMYDSGKRFTEIGLLFEDADTAGDIDSKIDKACEKFILIADMEERIFHLLSETVDSQ